MDSNSFRYLLIALAGTLAVCVNIPWRHAARSLRRGIASIATPRDFTAWSTSRAQPGRMANLPWHEIAHAPFAPAARGGSRLYAQARARARN